MKTVLISIQPKWCELIASGKKTIEVRKTKPKLDTPFKCYIYETKSPKLKYVWTKKDYEGYPWFEDMDENEKTFCKFPQGSGKVIGEFVCDKITMSIVGYNTDGLPSYWNILDGSCLTPNELVCYGEWKILYGWHISDLVIYDKPKELGEFTKYSETDIRPCQLGKGCEYDGYDYSENCEICTIDYDGEKCPYIRMQRPPQSWCYVEGAETDA